MKIKFGDELLIDSLDSCSCISLESSETFIYLKIDIYASRDTVKQIISRVFHQVCVEWSDKLFIASDCYLNNIIETSILGVSREELCHYNLQFICRGVKVEELKDYYIE